MTVEVKQIDINKMLDVMREKFTTTPSKDEVQSDEHHNEDGARVVTVCAGDAVRTKDRAG